MSAQYNTNMSLYIPHVFPNFTKEDVAQVFENMIGKVKNIDFVSKMGQDGKFYNAAYIHFEHWYDTVAARNFQSRVQDSSKEARMVYDEPWYWIVLENKARKHVPGERKPRIDLADFATPEKKAPVEAPKAPVKSSAPVKTFAETISPKNLEKEMSAQEAITKHSADQQEFMDYEAKAAEFNKFLDSQYELFLKQEDRKDQITEEMEECEMAMLAEDSNLISIDARYVQSLEEENQMLQSQLYELNLRLQEFSNSLYASEVKSQALLEALTAVSKPKI
jgi:hypothetical protein